MKKKLMVIVLAVSIILIGCTKETPSDKHICTEQEKQSEICTMDYTPVCGDNGKTYGNACTACSSKEINWWTPGECLS